MIYSTPGQVCSRRSISKINYYRCLDFAVVASLCALCKEHSVDQTITNYTHTKETIQVESLKTEQPP